MVAEKQVLVMVQQVRGKHLAVEPDGCLMLAAQPKVPAATARFDSDEDHLRMQDVVAHLDHS